MISAHLVDLRWMGVGGNFEIFSWPVHPPMRHPSWEVRSRDWDIRRSSSGNVELNIAKLSFSSDQRDIDRYKEGLQIQIQI